MGKIKQSRKRSEEEIPDARQIPVDHLYLDDQNPRLVETSVPGPLDECQMIRVLWQEMEVEEIAFSIAAHGYFKHEPLFAVEEGKNRYVVIEGNRRLAAVKLLLDSELRRAIKATNLPDISDERVKGLELLPVVVTSRKAIWQYVGFKHVNGPRPWGAWSKAKYISRVCNTYGATLDEVAEQIGDRHATVARLYRGLMVLEQAAGMGVYSIEDRSHKRLYFSHLYTGLAYTGIQTFLGLKEETSYRPDPVPKSHSKQLGQLCVWMFGSKSRSKPPLIRSQNPDLKILDESLQSKQGTDALTSGMPLQVAHEASRGDDRLFREFLLQAKLTLQNAFGKVHTGYDGKSDLLETAQDVYQVSGRLVDAMEEIRHPSPGSKPRGSIKKKPRGRNKK